MSNHKKKTFFEDFSPPPKKPSIIIIPPLPHLPPSPPPPQTGNIPSPPFPETLRHYVGNFLTTPSKSILGLTGWSNENIFFLKRQCHAIFELYFLTAGLNNFPILNFFYGVQQVF